ncbi:histidine-type phosphatase [Gilliamella sp. ESL0254]|uniref:histidine-type phosphatase n=1 Tax=Gilliamella sp. ESL0254 TaxID=2705035 RepID=UPI00157FFBB2|nr:histidine-type phosphatase [Gilliamella sp. ESL0254]NUF27640.1 histidine-type phosphatase [Gilliamella sp. ESL0254]
MKNNHYRLDKVVILSRHGIRTPLQNTLEFLEQATPFKWPTWQHPYGYLTTRGGALEVYFGHYLSQWLENHGIKPSVTMPEVFVYANSLQRTVATAQFIIAGAYAGYDITVNHKYPIEKMDPIFDPSLRDDSPELKQAVLSDIEETNKAEAIFKNLAPAYEILSDILDYRHSTLYAQYQCPLADIPIKLHFKKNEEPALLGALAIGASAVDAFLLQYYSAFPQEQIAWGRINDLAQWQQIVEIRNQYVNLICHTKTLAKHSATLIINTISDLMQQQNKVNLLVGHDSTIASLLGALNFESYQLPNQFETTPIGGKLALQRFQHSSTGEYFFKAEYIYQSFEQLYNGQVLDANNPPEHFQLKLKDAPLNSDGFYTWKDFEKRLNIYQAK